MKYTKEQVELLKIGAPMMTWGIMLENYISALDEIERLQEEARWIPTSEGLPKAKGEYLCCIGKEVFVSFYGDSWDGNLAFRSVIQPTHWRPLPQPPEVRG